MRLKISSKEALRVIDAIIRNGFAIYSPLLDQRQHNVFLPSTSAKYKLTDWYEKSKGVLEKVFVDFTPIYQFSKHIETLLTHMDRLYDKDKVDHSLLLKALDILSGYYDQLEKESYAPLFYISKKAQICFYASICQLEPDSNEATLCKFLFDNFSFHQWVEMELINEKAFGGNTENYDKRAADKVKNAYDGINRKTNEAFGFSVVNKQKTLLALNIPSRFIKVETPLMA